MIVRAFVIRLICVLAVGAISTAALAAPPPDAGLETAEPAATPEPAEPVAGDAEPNAQPDRIGRSPEQLPEPVRKTWQALVNAARSGNIEALRPLIDAQPEPPMFTFGKAVDPIDHLKSLSGDPDGREMLAILLEILEIGFVRVERGTENDMFIWPYFADVPLERLSAEQTVELFTILTAGEYQDMLSYGAYIFFRVGISPDGAWQFFVAGD